ncbi:PP2C family protein-serine/threonine phosphatase [Neotabrizicola shimadae]|nr:SpoIIE family protein phosphatase [Neotabrizicola shimadae]
MTLTRPLSLALDMPAQGLTVLVADDSRAQRMVLAMSLGRWGFHVVEAASGSEAMELCRRTAFDIVISDWVMPGLTGPEFCRAFRGLPRDGYGYFILLTSKSEKAEIAVGLDAGADDFLTKPVSADELRARLRSATRIIGMQRELVEKNRLVVDTLTELQVVHESLNRDLIEAKKLQQALVRDRYCSFPGGAASLLMRPSGHVGGDLVGWFEIRPKLVAIYSIDVSGHGIASAMLSAQLAGMLSGHAPGQKGALSRLGTGHYTSWPPEILAGRLNRIMLEEMRVDLYFTMAYAEVDLKTGDVQLVQAGHPHPVILRTDGTVEALGEGGLPIGLLPEVIYTRVQARLSPGDRLILASDGLTEYPFPGGAELGTEGLTTLIRQSAHLPSPALLEALVWDLFSLTGADTPADDISAAILDFAGLP